MLDFKLKCTKFNFGWGYSPDPAGGAYTAPLDPLAGLKGPTSKGSGGKEWEEGEGKEGEGKGDEVGEGKGGRWREGIGPPSYC